VLPADEIGLVVLGAQRGVAAYPDSVDRRAGRGEATEQLPLPGAWRRGWQAPRHSGTAMSRAPLQPGQEAWLSSGSKALSRVMRCAHLRSPVRGGVRRSGGLCASGVRGRGAIGYRACGSVGPDWLGLRLVLRSEDASVRRSGTFSLRSRCCFGEVGSSSAKAEGSLLRRVASAARGASAAALTRRGRGQRSGAAGGRNSSFSAALHGLLFEQCRLLPGRRR